MTKTTHQQHWDSYYESEPVSICASALYVLFLCLYLLDKPQQVEVTWAAQAILSLHSSDVFALPIIFCYFLDFSWFGMGNVLDFPCSVSQNYAGRSRHILVMGSCVATICVLLLITEQCFLVPKKILSMLEIRDWLSDTKNVGHFLF